MGAQAAAGEQYVSVDQHRIRLTNLDKVMYPETGTTKGEVLDYYARVADVLVPLAQDRPATRKRWVHGVGTDDAPGPVFFQKNIDEGAPEWIPRRQIQHSDHVNTYPLVNNRATLVWFAQMAALEIHVPQWRFGRTGAHKNPDRLVLDLDPGEGAGLRECVEVAHRARALLVGMGLEPYPVTSGSKGIHLYAALDGTQTSDEVSAVAHELARALEADHPDLVVSDMKKTKRLGKVLVDWSQNNANKTTIVPYSLRGRSHPTVAAPRTWDELDDPALAHLDFAQVLERVERGFDPIAPLASSHVAALEPTREHMAAFEATPESRDRLARYRSMRDAAKTPEPVPQAAPEADTDGGRSFVIQEHHATRLHWDFRLEHDGVLVSWALPKGVPTDPARNHLAVQTEDHPLEYGTFEGTIPKGEYGGGVVTIWDAGTYELHKWREGEEVIATLHGEKHGTHTYALIHTRGRDRDENTWLIHLMKDGPQGAAGTRRRHRARTSEPDAAQEDGRAAPAAPDERAAADRRDAPDQRDTPATADVRDGTAASAAASASVTDSVSAGSSAATRERFPRGRTPVGSAGSRGASVAPMLATLGSPDSLDRDTDWAFEMKWDGIRAIAHVDASGVRIVTRNGNDVTEAYHELAALGDAVRGEAVLDGEIVALDARGRPSFARLQNRMNLTKRPDIERAARDYPVRLFVFDVLELNGASTVRMRYDERRRALEEAVRPNAVVQVPPAFEGDLESALRSSRELGLEGVVAKDRTSTYAVGRRSSRWVKIKHHLTQEVVVGGWKPGEGRRAGGVGSLLLGVPDGSGLRYVGKVGTGFRDRDLDELAARFRGLERTTSPLADVPSTEARDARWITPRIVGEVEFGEWTPTGRLRQASWRGWRPDKSPEDVVVELPGS